MKLPKGVRLCLEIIQAPKGFKLQAVVRSGECKRCAKGKVEHGTPTWAKTELLLWMALETLAQDKIARIGLDATATDRNVPARRR